ncbi:alpha/beta hydrolase [Flavobacterium aquicola]|uniref:Alpha-beta hydrolase superfamily lysophospholipase n=1 Tax=Flavobacterium aquicola TaxID=1682742 RepID=A0A3E0ED19_9FLAO|nr:alpha/beta hydrolase [Flavobacterium aquicola]REG96141.1 alpha-beta hydrolase superfamily lysophospholipase [Flavobacterium aquicola]
MKVYYKEDVLKNGFKQAVITQQDDYEGNVVITLIRKSTKIKSAKCILYIHGFNDYFFQETAAEEFLKKGYNFYALDLRKYGRSILRNQKPNNAKHLSEYYEDIDQALHVIRDEGNTQVVLFGHSTGGLIITLYAAVRKQFPLFDALICNSPFYDFNVPWIQKKTVIPILSFLGRQNPNLALPIGFSKFYGKSLHTSDYGEWDYNLQWKPHTAPSINAGWINAIHEGHLLISRGISINKPILILHSERSVYPSKWSEEMFEGDAILNVKDIIEKSKLIDSPSKEVVGFKSAMHDLVLSKLPIRNLVFKTIFEWLEKSL